MAGSSKPVEKKQVSLTSFFTPRTSNGPGQKPQASPSGDDAVDRPAKPRRKRPLAEDADDGNGSADQVYKRAKPDSDGLAGKKPAAKTRRTSQRAPFPAPLPTRESNGTARAGRYAYDDGVSSGNCEAAEEEEVDEDDVAAERRKKELHKKFVKKLGHPDSMARSRKRDSLEDEETNALDGHDAVDGEGDAEEEEEEELPPAPTKNGKKKGSKTGKLTPMEMQFLDIKRKHMDTVLIVEVGYKFKFFGEDARVASKELGIVCIPGKFRYDEHPSEAHLDRFASASIPVHRLPVHAKRLVAAGHKVGVVRQIETAALKKAGDNRNAPFVRKLTNIYTKGTYVDEIGELDQMGDSGGGGAPSAGYLLCITEAKVKKGSGTDEKVKVGIIAVQPATGDIIYDDFEDGFMRREIETRLLHISPCEFLIVGELTKATEKLVKHLSGSSTNVFGDRSRVERVPKSKTMAAEASSHVTQFYAGKTKADDERAAALLDKVLKLPELVTICLSAMIDHLTEYGLEHIFDLTKYFQSFDTRQHMLLNGTTLESLEVYRNSTDYSETGSLFWAVDKTRTRFGRRQLRKWIGRPLLDRERLEQRLDAVQELLDKQSTARVDRLESLLAAVKVDLERSLIRIYYGKCTRPELLSTLQVLQNIAIGFAYAKSPADTGFESRLLSDAICSLPPIGEIVVRYLDRFNAAAARKDDKYAFFRESAETEDILENKLGIASVEHELDTYREDAAATLGKKVPVTYATVSGVEYLVEVANADLKRVPASWIKISGTKKLSRFHSPEVVRWMQERDQYREALAAACDAAFEDLLRNIAADYQPLRDAIAALATLDCLLSLARVAALPGYSRPTILPASTPSTIAITAGRHPVAEHTLPHGYIPFTSSLAAPAPLAHLITGPNMGGKSSYVRAVALLVILAQSGSFVPADAMRLTLADAVHTRMGARDNLAAGESTFMVEVGETAAILRSATPRSLVVLDELGRGTSTHDGTAIAHAVLEHVVRETRCLTLFITHYQSLARVAAGLGDGLVRCVHMRFTARKMKGASGQEDGKEGRLIEENDAGREGGGGGGGGGGEDTSDGDGDGDGDGDMDEEITFLYEVADGVAHRSYGLNVARLARLPRRVLDVAARKSREMEEDMRMRQLQGAARLLGDVLGGEAAEAKEDGTDPLDHLMASAGQL